MLTLSHPVLGFFSRWGTYFRERFPPLQYAIALGAFTFATLAYSAAVGSPGGRLDPYAAFVAFAVSFLTFLQLRIHDEFKDYEEDRLYRSERPVPRGLVSLRELGRLGWIAAALQYVLAAPLGARHVALLTVILGYSWLMRVEFFVRPWLKRHAGVYLLSHMGIVPLITLFVAACAAPATLGDMAMYLGFSYCSFCVFEVGRKVWAPDEERRGVETYTGLWGRGRAVAAWLAAVYGSGLAASVAAHAAGSGRVVAVAAVAIALPATGVGVWFVLRQTPVRGSWFRALSALWFVGIHAVFGVTVLLAR